ncbi:MAG: hypothetical protein M3680_26820, partial [Myxococcota bacterium]|nr:hypothetical protein [Myxococcota bacterium]
AGTGGGARGGGGGGADGSAGISPDSCGTINTSKVGRKLYSFLVASAELDRASLDLERSIHDACKRMAVELGVSPAGDIREVCTRAATELDANLKISVRTESRLVTRTEPPVCKTDLAFTASFVAQCEGTATADVDVSCEGTCGGTCNGACDGQCATRGANGQCAGQCTGSCRGRCSGSCQGYADVNASAECKASGEIRAGLRTTCSEPKVVVVRESVTVVDDAKFQAAMRAIEAGMPAILRTGAKLDAAGRALELWVTTGASLVRASGQLVGELGERAVCVGGQLAAVVAASSNIQARFSVSIEVSAQVSASAGANAR